MRATRFSRGALGAAGVLCLGLSGLGATALADPAGPGNIDHQKQGSIIIHKHVRSDSATEGDVSGNVGAKGDPVAGVTFTAYKLDADLTTNDAWTKLSTLDVSNTACGEDFKTPDSQVGPFAVKTDTKKAAAPTGQDGSATIADLAVGAYLVCETESPANVVEKAAPFVVTVPFPNSTENQAQGAGANSNGKWLYDVNVYPKNVLIEAPEKDVKVVNYGLNGEAQVEFPVTVTVPKIRENVSFKHFMISDPMADNYTGLDVKADSVTVDGKPAEATWFTKTVNNQEINISFTQEGLRQLKTKPNAKVTVTFTAKVSKIGDLIKNTANLYVDTIPGDTPPSNPPTTPPADPPVPSNDAVTAWGAASVLKTDKQSNEALQGAVFEIRHAKDPWAAECTNEIADTDDGATEGVDETKPVSIGGKTEFTTDEAGKFAIDGLFVDSKKMPAGAGPAAVDHTTHCYVLVEKKAPEGFTLPTGGAEKTALKVTAGEATTANQKAITNTKTTVPSLPLTGAAGKILMTVGGLSLMAIAVGFVLAARKRRANEA